MPGKRTQSTDAHFDTHHTHTTCAVIYLGTRRPGRDRNRAGGYPLPYRHHFFVCEPGAIEELGLDPADPDWELVDWDCARPKDPEACQRLMAKRKRR